MFAADLVNLYCFKLKLLTCYKAKTVIQFITHKWKKKEARKKNQHTSLQSPSPLSFQQEDYYLISPIRKKGSKKGPEVKYVLLSHFLFMLLFDNLFLVGFMSCMFG